MHSIKNQNPLKIDFHVHTKYSRDSSSEIGEVLYFAKKNGLDAIAITDHDTLEGSRKARAKRTTSDVKIIPAMEITLPAGDYGLHILAINIDEYIEFKNIKQAINELKNKKATLILPHPFRQGTGLMSLLEEGLVSSTDAEYVLNNIDYLEALNTKDTKTNVIKTLNWIKKQHKGITSGTDSHSPEYIGSTYTEIGNLDKWLSKKELSQTVIAFAKNNNIKNIRQFADSLQTGNDQHYFEELDKGSLPIDWRKNRSILNKIRNVSNKYQLKLSKNAIHISELKNEK